MMMKKSKKIAISITAAAFLSLTGVGVWAYAAPYSYVSLDVNPSIEYTLNVFDRVIDVEAVNDDGEEILENTGKLKNLTIEDAITKTVDQLAEDGYIVTVAAGTTADGATQIAGTPSTAESGTTVEATNGKDTADTTTGSAIDITTTSGSAIDTTTTSGTAIDTTTTSGSAVDTTTVSGGAITGDNQEEKKDIIVGGIVITISNKDIELTDELVDKIRDAVEKVVSNEVEVEVTGVGHARVMEARKLGVTPGKLNLVEKLKASSSDPDSIIITEWINKPVKDIMQAIKTNKKAQKSTTDIQTPETSDSTAGNDTANTDNNIADSTQEANTDATNNGSEIISVIGLKNEDADQNQDENQDEDQDADQDEDQDEDQDADQDEDQDDNKEARRKIYTVVKKVEQNAKKEEMKATKQADKSLKDAAREAKKLAREEAKEAEKLAKEQAKKASKEARKEEKANRETSQQASKATGVLKEPTTNDGEVASEKNNLQGKKNNFGQSKAAEHRNSNQGKGKNK